jgi:hypothetical protein
MRVILQFAFLALCYNLARNLSLVSLDDVLLATGFSAAGENLNLIDALRYE